MTKARKKQNKGLRGMLTVCIALALVLCGGMLVKPVTYASAAGAAITQDGYTLSCNYGLTAEYIIFARPRGEDDYINRGWSTMQGLGIKIGTWNNPMDLRPLYADGTLVHDKTYTIWIDGVGVHNNWDYVSMGTFAVASLSLPETPTREGHTFVGWYLDADLTIPYNGEPITMDMTFHAKFEINRFTVSFDSVGGSACDAVVIDWNTAVTDLPTPTRVGYDFLGWFDGAGNQYTDAAIKADTKLIARWALKMFTVTFMANGEVYKELTVEYGTSLQAAMQAANLAYMYALNDENQPVSKSMVVTDNVTVPIGEMTQEEKIATWIGNNWWALIAGGVLVGVLGIALAVAIVVARKRR